MRRTVATRALAVVLSLLCATAVTTAVPVALSPKFPSTVATAAASTRTVTTADGALAQVSVSMARDNNDDDDSDEHNDHNDHNDDDDNNKDNERVQDGKEEEDEEETDHQDAQEDEEGKEKDGEKEDEEKEREEEEEEEREGKDDINGDHGAEREEREEAEDEDAEADETDKGETAEFEEEAEHEEKEEEKEMGGGGDGDDSSGEQDADDALEKEEEKEARDGDAGVEGDGEGADTKADDKDQEEGGENQDEEEEAGGGADGGDEASDDKGEDEDVATLEKAENENGDAGGGSNAVHTTTAKTTTTTSSSAKSATRASAPTQPIMRAPAVTRAPSADAEETGPSAAEILRSVSPVCLVCRKLVIAHVPRDPTDTTRLYKPCRAVASEMKDACGSWTSSLERSLSASVDPNMICIELGSCTPAMISLLKRREAFVARRAGGKSLVQSGTLVLHKEDDIMREMYQGSGARRVDKRVEFPQPFETAPTVHLSLSRFAFPAGDDARVKTRVSAVDHYGFQVEVITWGLTKLETVGVDWIAYSEALSLRGEVRSGAMVLPNPASMQRRIYFPGTFAILPHVAVSVTGIDSDGDRDAHFSARAIGASTQGFDLQIETHAGATIKWASISWIAFQNSTQMYAGSIALDADADDSFKNFYYPPLGERSLERTVPFAPQTDLECGGGGGGDHEKGKDGDAAKAATTMIGTTVAVTVTDNTAVYPALHPWNSSLPVTVPFAAAGTKVAFVRAKDKGCFEAARYAVVVDGLHRATPPRLLTEGGHKVCVGPAGAKLDVHFVTQPGAELTVVRSKVYGVRPDLSPIPPGIPTILRVQGSLPVHSFVSLVPLSTVGCAGAHAAHAVVTGSMAATIKVATGDYKVCQAPASATGDGAYMEQWHGARPVAVHVGAGGPHVTSLDGDGAGPKVPETSLRAAILNDSPGAFWPLDDRHGSTEAREIGGHTAGISHPAAIVGAGVVFGGVGIVKGLAASVSLSAGGSLEARSNVPQPAGAFTVEAWVALPRGGEATATAAATTATGTGALQVIVQRRDGASGNGYTLGLFNGHAVCSAGKADAGGAKASSLAALQPGSAYHLACVHDGKQRIAVYVNGLEAGTGPATSTNAVPAAASATTPTVIGGGGFRGGVAAVAVYPRALAADRVYVHFSQGFVDNGSMQRCAGRVVRAPHFTDVPAVRIGLASFNFLRGSSANVRAMASRSDANGFTLALSTWGNARLKGLELTWIAHSQPPVPPRAAVRSASQSRAGGPNSAQNPGRSCRDILLRKQDTGNGVYFIRTIEGRVVRVLCDMDAGGYTRVVSISGKSSFHGGNARESNVGELSRATAPAKLSDPDINVLNTQGFFWFKCGEKYQAYVRNANNLWTSAFGNKERWSTSRTLSANFNCAANQPQNVWGEGLSEEEDCKKGYALYAGDRTKGCYVDGEGWQDGSLWAR